MKEAKYKGHKWVKVIVAPAHDLNLVLVVEEEDEELEIHDCELTTER